ncbi:MAG: UDP-glucose 4-epimerase, partial [Streptomycetaceae bacterium]|nr:UDP-glucose 4-epimerase [Streptomycetaceae bacterium]
ARLVTGHPTPADTTPRGGGDPAVLGASAERACLRLGWTPSRTDLTGIVRDAWTFAQHLHDQESSK